MKIYTGFIGYKTVFAALTLMLALSFTGCSSSSDDGETSDPAPSITSFTSSDATITVGGSTTLTSVFINGTGIVDNGVGTVTSGVGAVVTPATTTTYILTVTNSTGASVNSQTTVTVVPKPDFSASDMEGKWSLHGISFGLQGGLGDSNFKGWVELNASGDLTDGLFDDSSGIKADMTGGTLLIQDNGEFNGTMVAAGPFGPATLNIYGGKMAPSKNIMVGVDTSTDIGSNDLGTLIKTGGTFATADLQGTWYLFGPSVNAGLGSPEGTMWGSFELDINGNIIGGGTFSTSDGMTMTAVSGAFVMNTDGELTGTITANAGVGPNFDVTVDSGKMDPSKNIMFMTSQSALPSNELIVAVKSGGTFATADMAGKWYMYGVSTGGTFGKMTIMGNMDQDATGTVTNGSLSFTGELSGLQPVPVTIIPGGALALDTSGELSGAVDATIHTPPPQGDVPSKMTVVSGKMAPSKNMSIWVLNTDDVGQNGFVISIKGN